MCIRDRPGNRSRRAAHHVGGAESREHGPGADVHPRRRLRQRFDLYPSQDVRPPGEGGRHAGAARQLPPAPRRRVPRARRGRDQRLPVPPARRTKRTRTPIHSSRETSYAGLSGASSARAPMPAIRGPTRFMPTSAASARCTSRQAETRRSPMTPACCTSTPRRPASTRAWTSSLTCCTPSRWPRAGHRRPTTRSASWPAGYGHG